MALIMMIGYFRGLYGNAGAMAGSTMRATTLLCVSPAARVSL
jgi:hypothetical protein